MAFRDAFARCPRCAITLEDASAARGCRGCGGLFLPEPVLAEMLLKMLPPPPRIWGALVLSEVRRGEQALACPDCTEAMKPTEIHEVELDHCPKHGVWFDQDELRVTLYRVADPKNPPPFGDWEPAPFTTPHRPPRPLRPAAAPRPGSRTLVFHVVQRGHAPHTITTQVDVIKIGRISTAHVRIDDDGVSRLHAVIEVTHDELTIIDLGSAAGTFVNGVKVTKAALRIGDTIQLGATELVLASAT